MISKLNKNVVVDWHMNDVMGRMRLKRKRNKKIIIILCVGLEIGLDWMLKKTVSDFIKFVIVFN